LARKFLNTSLGFGLVPVGIFTVPRGDQLPVRILFHEFHIQLVLMNLIFFEQEMHLHEKVSFIGGECPGECVVLSKKT
jgi:hypothetical protein